MRTIGYVACSLDGYIAEKDGGLEWLDALAQPQVSYYDFNTLMADVDCVLMGANTFRKVLTFGMWPYGKKVFVYSATLPPPAPELAGKAELVTGTPESLLQTLEAQGFHTVYVDGGRTLQSFLKAGLLDELYLCQVAKLLGGGIPLFGELQKTIDLETVSVTPLTGQMTMLHYRVKHGVKLPESQ